MKRVVIFYVVLVIILLVSAFSNRLLSVDLHAEEEEIVDTVDNVNDTEDEDQEENIKYTEIDFKEMNGTFINGEVVLNFSLSNEDNLQISSLLINGETFREFEVNDEFTEVVLRINEGLNVGNKIYELEAIYYGNDVIELEETVDENNTAQVFITFNINGHEFLDIPQYPMDSIRITAEYNSQSYLNHYGIAHKGVDMAGINGVSGEEKIFSIADGEIVHIGNSNTAGKYLVIKHENLIKGQTVITRYLHLYKYENFSIGDVVEKGQLLGLEGATGKADGVHLHFETWIAPLNYDYNFYDLTYYVVDPIQYLFLHDFQTLSNDSAEKDVIKIKE